MSQAPDSQRIVTVTDRAIGSHGKSVAVRDYSPAVAAGAGVVWLHGGGFSSGGLDQTESDAVARALASGGRPVRAVDYRLVPTPPFRGPMKLAPSENRYPAAIDDVEEAILDFAATITSRIVIGGASAGANLAAAAALRLHDHPRVHLEGLALAYGTFHAELPDLSDDIRSRIRGPIGILQLTPDFVHRMSLNYVGDEKLFGEWGAFPATGNLRGLPPTLLIDADRDTLRASGQSFASLLRAAGVTVDYSVMTGALHGFLDRARSGAFRRGIAAIDGWLQERDSATSSQGQGQP